MNTPNLTQEQLDEMVKRVVPRTYWPPSLLGKRPKDFDEPPPVTNISIQAQDEFLERITKFYTVEQLLESVPRAYKLNWGYMMKLAQSSDWEKYTKSCSVWFNETITQLGVLAMEFILLHEIGHIDWDCRGEELTPLWRLSEMELYADLYAHDRLVELYDAPMAKMMLKSYGSLHGYGNKEREIDA